MDRRLKDDALNAVRGACMGAADIVPGISGGTVALLFGIYEQLLTSISHFDLTLLAHLRRREFRAAAVYIDLRFLVSLAVGLASGFVVMTVLINILLSNPLSRSLTLATFFGMIFASGVVVARMVARRVERRRGLHFLLGAVGAAFALLVTSRASAVNPGDPHLAYIFLCGAVGICAMILPGISGAMLLLVLGVYIYLTDLLKEFPRHLIHGEPIGHDLAVIGVFGAGCVVSLLSVSRGLKWLLANHYTPTMAVLCGFIFGALPKIWPFQKDLTPEIEKIKYKQFEMIWPAAFDATTIAAIALIAVAAAAVFSLDHLGRKRTSDPHLAD
ncbi:MAG: DUF368 domain-containing protein [Pirellulaceae bacterium]|nr:DUF368 domain-containing protein [Pirellulaceae bacterium]